MVHHPQQEEKYSWFWRSEQNWEKYFEPVGVAEKCNIICLCYPHHNNWGFVSLFPKKKISAKKNIIKKKHVKYKILCNLVPDHY